MKQKISLLIVTSVIILIFSVFGKFDREEKTVLINEIRSWDVATTRTGYYGSDYIELYNLSDEDISLDGWYLSDDESDLEKSRLRDITIGAKDYLVIYADGKPDSGTSAEFKINPEGEKIFLSNPEGILVDSVYVPKQELGTVYARLKDGVDEWGVKEPSMLACNNDTKVLPVRTLSKPVFSHESGFYSEEFYLTLSADYGETIYYTLDGSIPTENSNIYQDAILIQNISDQPNVIKEVRNVRTGWLGYEPDKTPVDKAMVVRAVAINQENCASEVVTHTYFVELPEYENKNILSIVAEYEDLFGDEGIFVTGKEYDQAYLSGELGEDPPTPNFTKSGRAWEIQGNLQLFYEGEEICNQLTGIRTYGGSSRHGKVKRMSFYAREEYSGSKFFEGISLGGRDVHSMGTNNSIGNLIFPQLLQDRSVAVQGIERTEVFLNGEYYSNTDLIEKYSKQYFEQKFGVSGDNILVIKDEEVSEGTSEDMLLYKWLQKQIRTNDLSIEENYAEIEQLMDIQSYIDYICANVYLCNMDMSQVKNYMLWRSIENDGTNYGDTRFRWMLYDMGALDDQISCEYYQVESTAQVNSFSAKGRYVGHSINEHEIYQALKENESYCKQFVLSFMDMANVNFSIENVEKVFEKWGFTADLYGDFFEKRFDYIVPYMAEEFGLTGTLEEVTLKINNAEGGMIKLNTTTPDLSEGSWNGKYYTDYPVTMTAVPAEGYEFVGWSGSVTSNSATIETEVVTGGIVLEAMFERVAN